MIERTPANGTANNAMDQYRKDGSHSSGHSTSSDVSWAWLIGRGEARQVGWRQHKYCIQQKVWRHLDRNPSHQALKAKSATIRRSSL